tara:strand:- start:140 stop:910 length:771 start_codon:yes stop_codon:yes gene_type:complete
MKTTGRLDGKVALITGAAAGLGRATAEQMIAQGAHVVLTDVNEENGRAVAEELGETASFETLDVTQPAAWTRVIQEMFGELGRLDILVNNAGVVLLGDIESLSLEEWRQVHAVNLDGVFLGCQNAVEIMKVTGGGSIINISSVSGLVGGYNLAAYNSSKGAVRLLTKSVALYCARAGYSIRCNSVHPTFIETAMVQSIIEASDNPERTRDKLSQQIPLGVIGEPDDVAHMIVYLASDESKFVTGAEFVVDGGVTAQ